MGVPPSTHPWGGGEPGMAPWACEDSAGGVRREGTAVRSPASPVRWAF